MAVVFALGSNGSGQLGIGHTEDVSVPKNIQWVDHPEAALAIAAGGNHTLIRCRNGHLYWSGDASSGACGFVSSGEQQTGTKFTKMAIGREGSADNNGTISMVAATWEASIFTMLDDQGKNTKIFTCGLGQKGELGQGQLVVRDPWATRLANFPPDGTEIVDLAACMGHVVVVLSNGDVYGWGNGRKGQLGVPDAIVFEPRKIENVGFAVKRAVCGKDFTCLLGDREQGRLVVLGQNKWNIQSDAPSAIPGWKDIGAGWGNIFVLKRTGDLVAWGRNDYSQSVAPGPQKISAIAVGSEHALALLESGDVVAWGWGEHGNCGPMKKGQDASKGQRNIIASSKYLPSGTSITGIGAGCATSWVFIEQTEEGS